MRSIEFFENRPEITSVEVLVSEIKAKMASSGTWYFRGDEETTDLKPSSGRKAEYAGKTIPAWTLDQERKLLDRFRRFSYGHLQRTASKWEALFLARHYDLPTRLLDWSASPLVALYFACSPSARKPARGVLWGILRHPEEDFDLQVVDTNEDPLDWVPESKPAVKLIYPLYNSERIVAQKGIFTWHSQPTVALPDYYARRTRFSDKHLDIKGLVGWPVPESARTQIIQELYQLGIHQRTIFPDIAGIARGLWQTEVLWS